MIELPPGNPAGTDERLRARGGSVHWSGLIEHFVNPASALGQVPALMPEPPKRPRRLPRELKPMCLYSPAQRRTEIVLFRVPVIQPRRLLSPCEMRFCVDCTRQERSEEHTSELQSLAYLVCRLLL